MTDQLKKLQDKLIERKSWIDAINKMNEISLNYIGLFQSADEPYAIEKIENNEFEYQELLIHLRGVQITAIEANAVAMPYFPADMFKQIEDLMLPPKSN